MTKKFHFTEGYSPEEIARWEAWYAKIPLAKPGDAVYFDWSPEKLAARALEVDTAILLFNETRRRAREQTGELISV